jgi:hypothetical protein
MRCAQAHPTQLLHAVRQPTGGSASRRTLRCKSESEQIETTKREIPDPFRQIRGYTGAGIALIEHNIYNGTTHPFFDILRSQP